MARLLWLLLPFVGSSLAKEGSVVHSLINSASGHSTLSTVSSLPVTHLDDLNKRDVRSSLDISPFTPQINPLVRRSSACKPRREPQGSSVFTDSSIVTTHPTTTAAELTGLTTSLTGSATSAASESTADLASSGTLISSAATSDATSTATVSDVDGNTASGSSTEISSTTETSTGADTFTSAPVSQPSLNSVSSDSVSLSTTEASLEISREGTATTVLSTDDSTTAAADTTAIVDIPTTVDTATTVDGTTAPGSTTVADTTPGGDTTAADSTATFDTATVVDTAVAADTSATGVDTTASSNTDFGATSATETTAVADTTIVIDTTTATANAAVDTTATSGTTTAADTTAITGTTTTAAFESESSTLESATASSGLASDTTSLEFSAQAASSETSGTLTSSLETQSSEASLSLTEFPSSSTIASSDPTTTLESVVSTSTDSPLVLTVAADGSGDYTAINDAIKAAQTSGYPTVTVLAGTYTENVVIAATPTVTIVGEASKKRDGSSGVVIDNGGNSNPALSFSTAAAGVTWRGIKFLNSLAGNSVGAVVLHGSKNAFYNCEIVSAGIAAITGSYASGIIANSYVEAQDKVIYNYPSLYVYGTTITATKSNALLVYNKGGLSGTTMYNSTVVLDTCQVVKKSGATNTRVFLAAGNGDGSVVVYRDSSLASGFLAASGVYVDAKTQSPLNRYVEFGTTGDVTDRSKYVTLITDPKDLSDYEVSALFKSAYPSVAVSSVDWIDASVLSSIKASNAKDFKEEATTTTDAPTEASSTESSSPTTTNAVSVASSGTSLITSSGASSATATTSEAEDATTSAEPTQSSCAFPSAVPSTAFVVGPKSNPCASYDTIASAVAQLPNDSTSQYIYILAGTYQEKVNIQRVGATVVRGQSSDGSSSKNNKVTITSSSGVLSSSGGSSGTATFSASKYETKAVSFYNINFENAFAATTNNVALAVYAKGKVAFYGCDINSSQGTLYLDYGSFFVSHSVLRGTTDFLWGQGAGYFYNSVIVSKGTTTGQAIAAHKFQGQYGGSRFVFDLCAVVPESNSVPEGSTFLGRDYSAKSNVAYVNSFFDAHIAPSGWKVSSPSTFAGTFTEGNNTGPGWDSSSRISVATIVDDTSSFSAASILGGDAWIDKSAIAPFQGWPDSKYAKDAATTSASATATASATSTTEAVGSTLTVAPSPTGGQFKTVASALAAIPDDGEDYTVFIKAGSYNEQLKLNRGRGRVTLRGETSFENDFTQNQVLIWFKLSYGTGESRNEETPVLFWKTTTSSAGLSLYNLNFTNTYPQTRDTASLAADFFGNNMAAYGCAFSGYQDSVLVNQGVQVFSNSYLEGSVDFIWGYSKAYFHQCYIASNTPNAYITAQNRKSSSWAGGFVFDTCKVTYTDSYGSTFGTTSLGRPWSQYALVVYMNSFLDKHISKAGWSTWSTSNPQISDVFFGEYNNVGPGNWTSFRASFATKLTESQAAAYSLGSFIGSTSWLDMKAYNLAPSYTIDDSSAPEPEPEVTWPSHPSDGTTPPKDAVLVSVDGEKSGSYSSLTDALKSLPKDSTSQVIFVYTGTYEEQVPSINRPGPITIIGYTETEPGKTYTSNQVTITQAKGLSVAGTIPAGRSNADTATIATASTKIAFYNVKFINTDNFDGATPSYVTLAASVYGDKIGFYGCSFIGWQDTLLTGATAGYQYYESSYIEGAIDFIWGYSKAYFKGCTLAAKRAKSAITAQSRKDANAIGGYIFDQCLFTEAASATTDLAGQVYLGRPYSAYALVVVKNSYLDGSIQPAGWKIWSTTDPRTDHVTFAEYANEGPGSWEKNSATREAFGFATLLTKDDYPLSSVMDSTDWIDKTFWDSIVTPKSSTPVVPVPDPNAVYSGKTPPPGAYIVSKEAIDGVTTYSTIQAAIDALPASNKVTPTVFIYPGTYKEQIILSRSGTTFFIGYSESPDDYTKNQVTITYDKGIDTQADASNSDSATFYATGNYFQAVNINFMNTFGTATNYASLGFAVKSSKFASLYGCQVYGNQDALLVNGNLFAYNSIITGNIDMIWGSGAGYFLKSTIAPNKDKIALTANKKGTNTGPNGFVFDQCTVAPADGASYSTIYLGRPWDQWARVAYIQTELSADIASVGWTAWTKSDPRTENVIFGEFDNSGPGASSGNRASFAKQLSNEEVAQFQIGTFFPSTSWINMTLVHATPFDAAVVATQTISSTTVYTTQTVTLSQTLFTTTTGADVVVTEKTTFTEDIGTTITPDPTTKTSIEKTTVTEAALVTQANKVVTVKPTEIVDVGKTITPAAVTSTSTQIVDATVTSWVTSSAKAVTATLTTTAVTVTPKSVTETVVERTTVVFSKSTTPKALTVKSTTTVTVGTGGVTTTSLKATTVVSTVVTTSVKTISKTTTLKCIPTQHKRDLGIETAIKPRAAVVFGNPSVNLASGLTRRELDLGSINLEARAAGLSTVTVTLFSTFTTNVKTSTMAVPASTTTTKVITTKTIGKTSTLKPATVIDVSTSVATRYATSTIPGSTSTTTVVSTKETGKTTTLKASTTTVVVASTSVVTQRKTSTVPASTVTILKTLTTTLPSGTVKVTTTSTVKQTSAVTLDRDTVTNWTTVKSTLRPSSTVNMRSTVSKMSTSVVRETKTNWATKTSKGAAICTN